MTFRPFPCQQRWQGLLVTVLLAASAVGAIWLALHRPIDGLSFLLGLWAMAALSVAAYLGYRTWCAFTLEYWVDRDGVTLVWGATRQVVPMGRIRRIQMGTAAQAQDRARPWHWPCPDRRRLFCAGMGVVNSYATRPLAAQLILVTDDEHYGLSPADVAGFLAAVQARYALGVARPLPLELQRPPLWTWPLWRDRSALFLIGAGLLGVMVMFGALCFRFPALPADLPLHFDVNGVPDRIAPKIGLLVLPVIGLLSWGFNLLAGIWVYRRVQKGGAYLLWGGALAVQVIAGLALFNLTRW